MRLWEMIAQRFRAPHLMERMMRRFGVIGELKDGPEGAREFRGAALRCMSCGEAKACREWLDEAKPADAPPAYCRNADLIARLRADNATLR